MKKLYAALSTLALLFSLPSFAGDLANKAQDRDQKSKEHGDTKEKQRKDIVSAREIPFEKSESPHCIGGGGG